MTKRQVVMFVGKISDEHKQAIIESRTRKGETLQVIDFDPSEEFRCYGDLVYADFSIEDDGMPLSDDRETHDQRAAAAISKVLAQFLGNVRPKQIQAVIYPHDVGNDWMWLREHLSKNVYEGIAQYYADGSGRVRFDPCEPADARAVL